MKALSAVHECLDMFMFFQLLSTFTFMLPFELTLLFSFIMPACHFLLQIFPTEPRHELRDSTKPYTLAKNRKKVFFFHQSTKQQRNKEIIQMAWYRFTVCQMEMSSETSNNRQLYLFYFVKLVLSPKFTVFRKICF